MPFNIDLTELIILLCVISLPIGLFVLARLISSNKKPIDDSTPNTCPFCKEEIHKDAVVCYHCKRTLYPSKLWGIFWGVILFALMVWMASSYFVEETLIGDLIFLFYILVTVIMSAYGKKDNPSLGTFFLAFLMIIPPLIPFLYYYAGMAIAKGIHNRQYK